jgi:basic membrane protein A and related proteins
MKITIPSRRQFLATFVVIMFSLTSHLTMAEPPTKVGFVYVGPVGDLGWTYQHDQGRKALESHYGDKIKTTYVESVKEGADAERVIRNLANSGHKIIFSTSFGFMNPTIKVSKGYPDVFFEHATGYKRNKNVSTYLSKTYEGRYIAGYVASKMSKTGKIGYIASFPIPEVVRDINAVRLAMNEVNPNYELEVIWVNTWYDPGKEANAANALIDKGVDVILQHTDSPAAMLAAEKRGVYAVGQASDMSNFGPNAHLLSVVNDWSYHYINTVKEVSNGTWEPEDFWGGVKDGTIKIVGLNPKVPADVRNRVNEILDGFKDGSFHPFSGPIRNQKGEVAVVNNHTMSNAELAGMNWFVQGVATTMPK